MPCRKCASSTVVAETKPKSSEPAPPPRPALLTKRGADILVRVERLMDDANRALGPACAPNGFNGQGEAGEGAPSSDALASSLEGRAFGNRN